MLNLILILFAFASAFAAPSFSRSKIRLGGKQITVEIADTEERREYGLMNREKMPADEGMLFIFDSEEPLYFWMKNTRIALNIGYFDKDRKLISKTEMVPASPMDLSPPTYPSGSPAKYALEMNTGWFDKNKIKLGDHFEFVESKPAHVNKTPAKSGSKTRAHNQP